MNSGLDDLIKSSKEINGVKLVTKQFDGASIDDLRGLSDSIKAEYKSIVMVFATVNGPKVTLMVSVTDDLLEKGYHAGNMIKQIAAVCGGGGGGKADMAQAGAKDASKLSEAFKLRINALHSVLRVAYSLHDVQNRAFEVIHVSVLRVAELVYLVHVYLARQTPRDQVGRKMFFEFVVFC